MDSRKYGKIFFLVLICFSIIISGATQIAAAEHINWHILQTKHFMVYCEDKAEGRAALKRAESLYAGMKSDFDYWPANKVSLYIYHDHANFLSESPAGISRAYSQPYMNRIFVSATKGSLDSAIAHELNHVVFLQSVPDATTIPFWFSEGIAIYWSDLYAKSSLPEYYPVQGEVYPISKLNQERPESSRAQERIAAQGYLAVQYLVDKYGREKFNSMIENLQEGMVFPVALERSTGVAEQELDKAWLVYASARSRQVYVESLKYFGLMIIVFLVFISVGKWFKRSKKKAEALKEEPLEEEARDQDY